METNSNFSNEQAPISSLLKRVKMFLADAEWQKANQYCERILDTDPENAEAYFYKFLASKLLCTENELLRLYFPLKEDKNFAKALSFSSGEFKKKLEEFIENSEKIKEQELAMQAHERKNAALDGTENAKKFLQKGEYKNALESLKPAKQLNLYEKDVLRISFLAHRACSCEKDLIYKGVPIDKDPDFIKLSKREDSSDILLVASLTALGAVTNLFAALNQGEDFMAGIWAKRYAEAEGHNPEIALLCKKITENLEKVYLIPQSIIELMLAFKKELAQISYDEAIKSDVYARFLKEAKSFYTTVMTAIKDLLTDKKPFIIDRKYKPYTLISHFDSVAENFETKATKKDTLPSEKALKNHTPSEQRGAKKFLSLSENEREFAEEAFACPVSFQTELIGMDDNSAIPALRFIYLAKNLAVSKKPYLRVIHRALDLSQNKGAMALEIIKLHKEEYISTDDLREISNTFPDIAEIAWHCANLVSNNFTRFATKYYATHKLYDSFISDPKDVTADSVNSVISELKTSLTLLDADEKKRISEVSGWANRAIKSATDKKEEYSATFNSYLETLAIEYKKQRDTLTEMISNLTELFDKKFANTKKSIFTLLGVSLAFSAAAIGIMLGVLFTAKKYFENPLLVIEYNTLWFYIVTISAALIIGFICLLFHSLGKSIYKKKIRRNNSGYSETGLFSQSKAFKIISAPVPVIIILLALISAGLLVSSAAELPKKLGTIPLSEADDLRYIKNAPYCSFILDADIDLEGKNFKKIPHFSGELDGQGHKISNFAAQKEVIGNNSGIIKNITFENGVLSGGFISKNSSIIEAVTLTNLSAQKTLIKTNKDAIKNLTVQNCVVTLEAGTSPKRAAMIIETNGSDAVVSECIVDGGSFAFDFTDKKLGGITHIGGFNAINNGKIYSVIFSAAIDAKITVTEKLEELNMGTIAGFCYMYDEEAIAGCASSSIFNISVTDQMHDSDDLFGNDPEIDVNIGGLLGNGLADCSAFLGELNINYALNDTGLRRTSSSEQVYNIGGLVGHGATENSYSRAKINTDFAKNENDNAQVLTYVGTLIGDGDGKVWVKNSYSYTLCNLMLLSGNYDSASMVGCGHEVDAPWQNSFVCVDKQVKSQLIMHKDIRSYYSGDMKPLNCYCSSGYGYDNHWSLKEGEKISRSNFTSVSFIRDKLGWDESIWHLQGGKLPTLNPYSPPIEQNDISSQEGSDL